MNHLWKELIGYLAPVFIVLSMMQSHVKNIRLLMIAGCAAFVIYGTLVEAWPVVAANAIIGIVTGFYLVRSQNVEESFSVMDVSEGSRALLNKFLAIHRKDLKNLYPLAENSLRIKGAQVFFLMKDLEPVGLFCYKKKDPETAEIFIDYVGTAYRDFLTERYFYSANEGHLAREGIRKVVIQSENSSVIQEMKKMGFEEQASGFYVKNIV